MSGIISGIICDWTTYGGSHCKKIIGGDTDPKSKELRRFCGLHQDLIVRYTRIKEDELCETSKDIKISPRTYKHVKSIMTSLGYEDEDIVEVYLPGGSVEEANISNKDYITLVSDNSRFYYLPEKGQSRAKDLKILLKKYCQSSSVVHYAGIKYCEECYKNKVKDCPRISLIS